MVHPTRQTGGEHLVQVPRRLVQQHFVHRGHTVAVGHLAYTEIAAVSQQGGRGGEAPAHHLPPPPGDHPHCLIQLQLEPREHVLRGANIEGQHAKYL